LLLGLRPPGSTPIYITDVLTELSPTETKIRPKTTDTIDTNSITETQCIIDNTTTIDTPNNISKAESTAINNSKHKDTTVPVIEEEFVNLQLIFEDSDEESTENITSDNSTSTTITEEESDTGNTTIENINKVPSTK